MARLDINVGVNGANKVEALDKSLKNLENTTSSVNRTGRLTQSSFGSMATVMATAATAIYAIKTAFDKTLSSGIAFNSAIETSTAGLSALALTMQDKAISATQRLDNATNEASATMQKLQEINAKTPHTLDQTNQIYKAMYVSMRNVGASSSEIIGLTQKLSVAAGAAGIEFGSLLAGVDGIATGTVLANSDLGRFLNSLGLTNAELKNSTDVVALLNEKLSDFKALDTYETAVSNLQNSWDMLSGKLSQDIFVGIKDGFNEASNILNKLSDEDISGVRSAFDGLAIGIGYAVSGIAQSIAFLYESFQTLGAGIAEVAFRLEHGIILNDEESAALERMYEATQRQIDGVNNHVAALVKGVDVYASSITASQNRERSLLTEAQAQEVLNQKIDQSIEASNTAWQAELDKINADELAAEGLNEYGYALDNVARAMGSSIKVYDASSQAAGDYSMALDKLAVSLNSVMLSSGNNYGVGTNQVTSFSTVESTQGWTPQDYYSRGLPVPSDIYSRTMPTSNYTSPTSYTGGTSGGIDISQYILGAMNTKLDNLYEINKSNIKILNSLNAIGVALGVPE